METTMNQGTVNLTGSKVGTASKTKTQSKFWEMAEFNRFGIISMVLLIIGIVGGLAASFGAQLDVLKLGAIVFPTIFCLAFILSVSPMKLIIYSAAFALIVDLCILMF